MKIRDVSSKPISTPGEHRKTSHIKGNFEDHFNEANSKTVQEKLNILLSEIDRQGKILGEKRTLNELIKYRKLIRDFIDEAIKNGLENEESHSWGRGSRLKSHTIVNKIDEQLLRLTNEIVNQEEDVIGILKIIGEIKGLLIDLYI
ncbi:MAG TPA: YaaR family protein [Thermoanaerobacterales bacterium]|nr:YaaR family protein [Thermoanaerobacterales bacterium]